MLHFSIATKYRRSFDMECRSIRFIDRIARFITRRVISMTIISGHPNRPENNDTSLLGKIYHPGCDV